MKGEGAIRAITLPLTYISPARGEKEDYDNTLATTRNKLSPPWDSFAAFGGLRMTRGKERGGSIEEIDHL
jgi:hypothetical protein